MGEPVNPAVTAGGSDPLLDDLIEELTARMQAGDAIDPAELARRHPERAAEILQLLPALEVLADLGQSTGHVGPPPARAAIGRLEPGVLGDFQIIREVGRGGMGVVYEAQQISLGRRVALKVLPFAGAIDPKQLRRFQSEAQAAAQLHHSNIVPVYAIGCERGVHYYAMQFIDGQSLAEAISGLRQLAGLEAVDPSCVTRVRPELTAHPALESRPLPELRETSASTSITRDSITSLSANGSARSWTYFRTVARLGKQAAEGLEHAHDLGVIHRDIKPANLLLDTRGNLWITDFGLARFKSQASCTISGDLMGTIRYMSPEQALAKRVVIDHRTDIYSLGVTLYELLTLEPAFGGRDRQELLRQIAFEEPRPLRKINRAIPAELETIVLKAISKNPGDRYSSAQDLADDLERFLEDKPIRAKRPTLPQRIAKWARRHRAGVISGAACLAGLLIIAVVALAVSNRLVRRERDEKELALRDKERALATVQEREQTSRSYLYAAHMNLANQAWEAGNVSYALELLEAHQPRPGEADLRGFEWYYLWNLCHPGRQWEIAAHHGAVTALAFSSDGRWLLSGGADGSAKRWSTRSWQALDTLAIGRGKITGVSLSSDDRQLAVASQDEASRSAGVAVWDLIAGRPTRVLPGVSQSVAFVPAANALLTVGAARASDPATGRTVRSLAIPAGLDGLFVLTPDGKTLVTAGPGNDAAVWDLASGERRGLLQGHRSYLTALAISPDGKTLATGANDWSIRLWNVDTAQERATLGGGAGGVRALAFSPDGKSLAAAYAYQSVIVWELAQGRVRAQGSNRHVGSLAFDRDGQTLAMGTDEGSIQLWDLTAHRAPDALDGTARPMLAIAFSPDSQTLATGGADGSVSLWEVATGRLRAALRGASGSRVTAVTFSPSLVGDVLVSGDADGRLDVWDLTTGRELTALRGHAGPVTALSFSRDGRQLASGSKDQSVRLWDLLARKELTRVREGRGPISALAFSPDGRQLLTASDEGPAECWQSGSPSAQPFALDYGSVLSLAFSPNGQALATAHLGGALTLWKPDLKTQRQQFSGHRFSPRSVSFIADGRTLASGSVDGTLKLWDTSNGQVRATFQVSKGPVVAVAAAPDGEMIATIDPYGTVRLWRASRTPNGPGRSEPSMPTEPEEGSPPNDHTLALWNNLAWMLATCPDAALRNPERSVQLAAAAVKRNPDAGIYWNTLGIGQYRSGRWNAAIEALTRSTQLRSGGDPFDWWFLAMAHWQLGHRDEARRWQSRASDWVAQHGIKNEELARFQVEASLLMGDPDHAPAERPKRRDTN